jgi:hypothetical protein
LSSEGMEALMNNVDDIETSIDNEEQ